MTLAKITCPYCGGEHNNFDPTDANAAIDEHSLKEEALTIIKDFLEWGAKTGSDRDLFDNKFKKILGKAGVQFTEPT